MKIAVTGANGFIASHIIKQLSEKDDDHDDDITIVACVRTDTADKTNYLKSLKKVQIASGCDMSKEGSYDDAFQGVDIVIHVAAVVDVSGRNPQRVIEGAVNGTKNVVQSVLKHSSTIQRFIFTSSIAAIFNPYGKPDDHIYTEKDWNEWSSPTTDPYGYGKTQSEKNIWDEISKHNNATIASNNNDDNNNHTKKIHVVVINPSVVLGPCLTKQHTKSSASVVREIIYGNRMYDFTTSFVDVRDVARAHVVAAFCEDTTEEQQQEQQENKQRILGKRFILSCDHEPMKTTDLATMAQPLFPEINLVGKPVFYLYPGIYTLLKVTGMITQYQVANIERKFSFANASSKELLGIEYHSIEDTLKDTINSMIQPQNNEKQGWIKTTPRSFS